MSATTKEKDAQRLISKACKAYGIDEQYVLGSGIDAVTGEAIIVTHGGKKVRYREGASVTELTPTEVTGEKARGKYTMLKQALGLQSKDILGSPRQGKGITYPECDLFDECREYAKEKGWEDFNCSNCP